MLTKKVQVIGLKGATGNPGITPHVGENGNWFEGVVDTGRPAYPDDTRFGIEESAEGTLVTINDSYAEPCIKELTIYGKSTQDGTPTPEVPVEIVSVGDSGSLAVTAAGKNLLPYPYYGFSGRVTKNGITFTDTDGAITLRGSAQQSATIQISSRLYLENRKYKMSGYNGDLGILNNTNVLQLYLTCYNESGSILGYIQAYNPAKNPYDFEGFSYAIANVFVLGGYSFTEEHTIYPMLELGSTATTYEPYRAKTITLNTGLPLMSVPVSSGGNYTDENGQQYIADTLEVNADGTGRVVKRIASTTIPGDPIRISYVESFADGYTRFTILGAYTATAYDVNSTYTKCSHMVYNRSFTHSSNHIYFNADGTACLCINSEICDSTYQSVKDWIKLQNTNGNPLTIVYRVASPEIITLTAAEVRAVIFKLNTFKPITNLSNDAGAHQSVTYTTGWLAQNDRLDTMIKRLDTTIKAL